LQVFGARNDAQKLKPYWVYGYVFAPSYAPKDCRIAIAMAQLPRMSF
jgi:hypothetical protein